MMRDKKEGRAKVSKYESPLSYFDTFALPSFERNDTFILILSSSLPLREMLRAELSQTDRL